LLFRFNFTFASTTESDSHNQINAICELTQDPYFCITSLEGFLLDKKADLNRLGVVSILLPTTQAILNRYVIEQLMQIMVDLDSNKISHLENFQVNYDVTLDKSQFAYHLYQIRNIIRVWLSL